MSATIRVDAEVFAAIQERKRELYQGGNPRPTNSDAVASLLQSAEADRRMLEDPEFAHLQDAKDIAHEAMRRLGLD